ncbi:CD209 antigen-like protein C [Onychostoma macrolepis]|uniref:CD209 antigen-like protein C n=1 Tax=Onychostoma macrolepis TaxID=369639 RepID=UPI00272C6809|nr:CD209 antigen-like protein C [Onychostoma macrolepis]
MIMVEEMKRERVEMTVDIYESVDCVTDHDFTTKTNTLQPLQHTGSDSVKSRSSRAAVACLVLLCVLLLTAVIVLCVHIHTNNTNNAQETKQLQFKITNLTEERAKLINQLSILCKEYEWINYQSSFYFMSTEKKNWTESRRDCLKRGADLIIINNKEEQDFVKNITEKGEFWIGLTDTAEEDRWKWVDGTNITTGFWASSGEIKEPNGGTVENCAVTYLTKWTDLLGWLDVKCNGTYQWICEMSIWP